MTTRQATAAAEHSLESAGARKVVPGSVNSGEGRLPAFHLSLLGTFQLVGDGVPLVLPGNAQRLLAFLALHGRRVTRAATAGTLWPDASESRAHASLRSALSRLGPVRRQALEVDLLDLRIAPHVTVDIKEARALAQRLVTHEAECSSADVHPNAIDILSAELLPDWYDEWVLCEAEDWRQLRLHALESLADRLVAARRYADASRAVLAAISAEPLRESAQARLLRIHLAEGNQAEALRAFGRYREQLIGELGLQPTPALRAVIRDLQLAFGGVETVPRGGGYSPPSSSSTDGTWWSRLWMSA